MYRKREIALCLQIGARSVHVACRALSADSWTVPSRRDARRKEMGISCDAMTETMLQTIPILRIFDVGKAREFYVGFLGFTVDWGHRFDDQAPNWRRGAQR